MMGVTTIDEIRCTAISAVDVGLVLVILLVCSMHCKDKENIRRHEGFRKEVSTKSYSVAKAAISAWEVLMPEAFQAISRTGLTTRNRK